MTLSLTRTDRMACTVQSRAKTVTLGTYFDVWKQRRALARLDMSTLKDLGISQAAAQREAARPFWDLPF